MTITITLVVVIFLILFLVVVDGAQVPAVFVFGDSLVDPGNNNNLTTLAKANYPPNGIDFPLGVTGRYCNGATSVDHLVNLLGLPPIPPFNNPNTTGKNILQGVNYASAASGILDDTGKYYGKLWPMNSQINNFEKTLGELSSLVNGSLEEFLSKSLFSVVIGSNDYINNYLLPFSDKPRKYTPETYADSLLQEFNKQLKTVYKLGGRKFVIAGLGPLGCMPSQIANLKNASVCVNSTNQLAFVFNSKLKTMLDQLNAELKGAYFFYWDTYTFAYNVIDNYQSYGFKYQNKGCCGGGRHKGQIICLPLLPFECKNRSEYVFWDPYHPTDAFNAIAAKSVYQGNMQANFPRNVQDLIQM